MVAEMIVSSLSPATMDKSSNSRDKHEEAQPFNPSPHRKPIPSQHLFSPSE